jgi:hypothetical protein
MSERVRTIAALAAAATACGGSVASTPSPPPTDAGIPSDAKPLDCAWVAGNNCWRTKLADLPACAGKSGLHGTFSADRKSCAYPDGMSITFDTPVPAQLDINYLASLTIVRSGSTCLRLEQTDTDLRLTTPTGTLTAESGNPDSVTCEDGTVYATTAWPLTCDTSLLPAQVSPTWGGDGSLQLNVLGLGVSGVHLFLCE